MASLPAITFYWRQVGGADDSWTEDADGVFTPTAGANIEVKTVGPSPSAFITADTTPSVTVADLSVGYDASITINPTYGGTNRVYSLSGPDWLSINASTGQITGTAPSEDFSGSATVTVRNAAGTASDTFAVAVQAIVSVSLPAHITWDPGVAITRQGSVYSTDFDIADYYPPTAVTYYLDAVSGDDANDGLSSGSPKQSLDVLRTALVSSPPAGCRIIMAAGDYFDAATYGAWPCNYRIEGADPTTRIGSLQSVSWTKTSEQENVYQTNYTAPASVVDDTATADAVGVKPRLNRRTSIASVDANPGSSYESGGVLYVHTHDGRAPDADVLVFAATSNLWNQTTTGRNGTIENVAFCGGAEVTRFNFGSGVVVALSGVHMLYGSANGLATLGGGAEIYVHECVARYNGQDGFNYKGGWDALEIDVVGGLNGWGTQPEGTNGNDQSSTAHDTVQIVRIGGDYRFARDQSIADVNTSQVAIFGATVGDSRVTTASDTGNAGLRAVNDCVMYAERCTSVGGVTSDAVTQLGADVTLVACVGFDDLFDDGNGGSITVDP